MQKCDFKFKLNLFLGIILSIAGFSQSSVGPILVSGEAQIVPEFKQSKNWIRHDLWVETTFDSDGDGKKDRMHVAVTRPHQTESEGLKLPVIYISSPYFAGVANLSDGVMWNVQHELGATPPPRVHPEVKRTGKRPIISNRYIKEWVPRGFIVVHSSAPGTGLSEGAPTVGGIEEALAPKAVIEWLTGKDNGYSSIDGDEKVSAYWSTGKVGMMGTSYNGTIPLAAATTGVEGLEAIIPIAPNTSYYHYYRSNGLVRHPGGYLGEDIDVLYDFIHSGAEDKRAKNNQKIRDSLFAKNIDRETGDFNDFWASRDYLLRMDSMQAALFMSHGLNDWNVMPEHSYRIYQKAKDLGLDTRIYYHQNGHGGPPPFNHMNRWFTRFLFGVENGVESEPQAWIVRENDDQGHPTPYDTYPNPKAKDVRLYMYEDGNEKGALSYKKNKRADTESWTDDFNFSGSELAQAEASPHRLLYVSPPLQEDIHLSGLSEVLLRLKVNKPAANLSVWLVSLPWDGKKRAKITDNLITRGWADPQNYKSITQGEPLQPGQFYDIRFQLQPDDQIIAKGQQIGLMIFSTDQEFTLWPAPGTELTLDLTESYLSLPVVGGKKAWVDSVK